MTTMKTKNDYWFTIEPYVYINITPKAALLYNTLDKVTVESEQIEIIGLLQELLIEKNCGVVLLENERYQKRNIKNFITELREKYMGDIIDVAFSKSKPVQVLPYINYYNKRKKSMIFRSL